METGTVNSWNDAKGYGFIQPDSGAERVFFHISAVQGAWRPQVGDRLSFVSDRDQKGRLRAQTVNLAPGAARPAPRTRRATGTGLSMWLVIGLLLLAAAVFYRGNLLQLIYGESPDSAPAVVQRDFELNKTLALIKAGGPFPYSQDGTVFNNRERKLPSKPRGYYHEYTVPSPHLNHRGPRRVVTGGNPPKVYYYTSDHYRSFHEIPAP